MRCPDCAKFVSFDEPRVDEIEVTVEDGELRLAGTMYLPCGECGMDLKSAELEESIAVEDLFPLLPDSATGYEVVFELESDPTVEATDRQETTDKRGKPIKNPRGWRTFYGAETCATVKRKVLNDHNEEIKDLTHEIDIDIGAECQASDFEECC